MKQAAATTTTTKRGDRNHHSLKPKKTSDQPKDFMMAALNMSWQLAIVVLVPILGGYALDTHFKSLPLWTAVGFVLAMLSMVAVVWQQYKRFSPKITKADIENARKLREKEEEEDDQ